MLENVLSSVYAAHHYRHFISEVRLKDVRQLAKDTPGEMTKLGLGLSDFSANVHPIICCF